MLLEDLMKHLNAHFPREAVLAWTASRLGAGYLDTRAVLKGSGLGDPKPLHDVLEAIDDAVRAYLVGSDE